jgi:PAS domain S-box-containing protein
MAETRRTLLNALNALDDVFYVYDEHGRLVFWNERLTDLFDLTDEEIAGMWPTDFFLDADRPAVDRAVDRIFGEGETVVEAWADTTEGRTRFELTGRKLTDEDGGVLGFCGIGRDVTERRERERQLAAQNDRLSQFATILAHDLRNPLAVAKGYLDRYQVAGDDDDIERVTDSLVRIERIVDDVLTVAIEGQAVTDARPVAIGDAGRSAVEMIDDDVRLDVRTTLVVAADESRLRRLFENLFRNSVEHGSTDSRTESGDSVEHADPSVTISITETADGFAVTDDGPGIPAAVRDRVFEPGFTRADDGTGFGLYIVRTIAEAHGWTVTVTDGEDGGAHFEFATTPVVRDVDA